MGLTNKDQNKKNFLEIIKSVILKKEIHINSLEGFSLDRIIKYAKFHSLEYITYLGLKQLEIDKEQELFKDFKKIATINAYKSLIQDAELELICNELEHHKIKHMPLKGALVRKLYPDLQYRSMADLDILIPSEDLRKAGNVLKELGYTVDNVGGNHDNYIKKPYMNIELHRGMIDESYEVNYYDNVWDRVRLVNNKSYLYELSDEDFFVFMVVHAAKHFGHGGTGFRTIIDIYYYLEQKKLDFNYINLELKSLELEKFSYTLIAISEYIFKGKIGNINEEDINIVLNYILDCGTYGTIENSAINSLENKDDLEKSKKNLIIKKLFPPYKIMKRRNPVLTKIPILLPWFWFERLVKGLFNFKEHQKTYQTIKNVDSAKVEEINTIKEITGVKI